ncbi:MAG: hypothetical protein JO090_08725, partial [Rhizobacter sp.]|nr:hypothetical protein [Rhizobacter sp.]
VLLKPDITPNALDTVVSAAQAAAREGLSAEKIAALAARTGLAGHSR